MKINKFARFRLNMHKLIILFVIVVTGCGWSDYSKEIAPGWSIHRMNAFDKVIGKTSGELPYTTSINLGPLTHYSISGNKIYAKHFGAKYRKLFEGDTFIEADATKVKYMTIDMVSGDVDGPFDKIEQQFDWVEASAIAHRRGLG